MLDVSWPSDTFIVGVYKSKLTGHKCEVFVPAHGTPREILEAKNKLQEYLESLDDIIPTKDEPLQLA
jgi:hypothetical protein